MQWKVLLATMSYYLFFYTGRQTLGFVIPGIQAEMGLSKKTLGWISTAMLWSYAVGQAINGNLADKFGSVVAFLAAVLVWERTAKFARDEALRAVTPLARSASLRCSITLAPLDGAQVEQPQDPPCRALFDALDGGGAQGVQRGWNVTGNPREGEPRPYGGHYAHLRYPPPWWYWSAAGTLGPVVDAAAQPQVRAARRRVRTCSSAGK
ncbi:MFS transporter [Saccharopolyspora shandongensis]|uniref:MFS transporter n=1 Tax=Saccharopolyspora shandongensis TaxID=418495 RepID=UPI003432AF20